MVFSGSIFAQNAISPKINHLEKGKLSPNTKAPIKGNTSSNRAAGAFSSWFEPVGDVMFNKGLNVNTQDPAANQDIFLNVIHMDSTVQTSTSNGTRFIDDIFLGSVLDPKSLYLQPNLDPVVTKYDPYTVDSLVILGSYVKVVPTNTDTLYVSLVWGDTTNSVVWAKRTTASAWVAPISSWRPTIIAPKVKGATAAAGNKIQVNAPASNKLVIKYVLTDDDTSSSGFSKYINIPLPAPVNVPAGNIVSCIYTFVSGGTHNLGDVSYHLSGGADAQVMNGFAGLIWNQINPAVAQLSDLADHQVDPTSFNMGVVYPKDLRHAQTGIPASFLISTLGNLTQAPIINYKISGVNTTGVNELNNNFSLGQNVPNPFTNQTKINYQIKTASKSVSFDVYNVTGVKVFNKSQSNVNSGSYSVELNDVDFASGIYFYSLTVDGNKVTKKMVVNK